MACESASRSERLAFTRPQAMGLRHMATALKISRWI
jgi:hypothetical protein